MLCVCVFCLCVTCCFLKEKVFECGLCNIVCWRMACFVVPLWLCVFYLHVLVRFVCDLLCDAVCGVSLCVVLLFNMFVRVVCVLLRCCTDCNFFACSVVCLCLCVCVCVCLGVLCVRVFCLKLIV